MPRTIAVVTSSRADYGHLYWPLRELEQCEDVSLQLLVFGAHLSPEFGRTVSAIERDGFEITEKIETLLSSDTDVGMAKSIGLSTLSFADTLGRLRPDLLLVIADRYEMLAPSSAALALRIPIAHIEGGEISEGAIDHAVRNALTMMSHVHFTPTVAATQRVIAMGEDPERVHQVGAPSLDHLRRSPRPDRAQLEATLGLDLSRSTVVVAYHPVTLNRDTTSEADAVFESLRKIVASSEHQIVFCFPNADAGSRHLIDRARAFCADYETDARLFVNLDHLTYWSLLEHATLLFGNSSSGIMEAPSLELPVVNIGLRQRGRERAINIIDAEPNVDAILNAVKCAVSKEFRYSLRGMNSPYGDGRAGERIAQVLGSISIDDELLVKRAVTLEPQTV